MYSNVDDRTSGSGNNKLVISIGQLSKANQNKR